MIEPARFAFYTDATEYGGAENSLANLLAGLGSAVAPVLVAVDARVAERIAARRPGLRVVMVPPVADKRDVRAIAAHVRAFRALAPAAVQVNLRTPWAAQYGLLAASLLPRVRIVAVQHSPIPPSGAAQRVLRGLLNRRVTAQVAVSDGAARLVEDGYGMAPGTVWVIRNGAREPAGEAAPRIAPGPVVACLARLSPEKGVDLLVRALGELPGVSALVLGDGPERAALEALAAAGGVTDRVRFAGWVDDPGAHLLSSDLLVLPSRYEALPLAVIEGMLAGLPVIAADVGSVAEIVQDGVTGVLVAPDDPAALAAAIGALLADPERRAQMGLAGREAARASYSLHAMAAAYEQLYRELGVLRGASAPNGPELAGRGTPGPARNSGEWS